MQARQAAASGNIEQAISVLDGASRQGGRTSLVAEARRELEQKKFDGRVTDYLRRASDRMRKGDLLEPPQDNARFFIESARAIAPADPEVRQAQRSLSDRLVAEARKSLNAGSADQADKWIQAAADAGLGRDEINSMTREEQRVRTTAKADSMAHTALLFSQRMTQGRLVEPAADSAKFYLTQLMQSDATHPSTVMAKQTFASRSLEEARAAVRRQDYTTARRWLFEAHDAGADEASVSTVDRDMVAAQTGTNRQPASDAVPAGTLQLVHYVPPVFPAAATDKGLTGWVDVQFMIRNDGTTSDITIVGAEPVGVFEQSAMESVRKWRYKPVIRNGKAVDQAARLRLRFNLEK